MRLINHILAILVRASSSKTPLLLDQKRAYVSDAFILSSWDHPRMNLTSVPFIGIKNYISWSQDILTSLEAKGK